MISVIIPVYNAEKYLIRCLESICTQTYSDLQIICIDDGSTDYSKEILFQYEQRDERFLVVNQKNCGVSNARNVALTFVKGEFFCFVDPDDWIEPNMLEFLLSLIQESESDIASCSYCYDSAFESKIISNKNSVNKQIFASKKFFKYIFKRDNYKAVGGYIWTRIYRTSSLIDRKSLSIKVRFDEDIFYGEGILFLTRAMLMTNKVSYSEKPLYHYCQNDLSAMHNPERRLYYGGSLKAYDRIIKLLQEENISMSVIVWVKRFYAYLASVLVEDEIKINSHEYDDYLKKEMNRYLLEYLITNLIYPNRIIRFFRLKKWIGNDYV